MIDELKPLLGKLSLFAKDRLKFSHPPKLFLKNDIENSNMALGKTAHYNPEEESVTLYVTKRHPKDILRSFAHELVHHTQNLRGDLAPEKMGHMDKSYAQDNEHMRNMEKEAYLQGNMCFRDWEDGLDKKELYIIKIAESKFLKESKKVNKQTLEDLIRKIITEQKDNPFDVSIPLQRQAAARAKKKRDARRAAVDANRAEFRKKQAEMVRAKAQRDIEAINNPKNLSQGLGSAQSTKDMETYKNTSETIGNIYQARQDAVQAIKNREKDELAALGFGEPTKRPSTPKVDTKTAVASTTPSVGLSGQGPNQSDQPETDFSDLESPVNNEPETNFSDTPVISEPEPSKAAPAKAPAKKRAKKRAINRAAIKKSVRGLQGGKLMGKPFTKLSRRVARSKAFAQSRLKGALPGDSIAGLQRMLIAGGYLPLGDDDGKYGSRTYSAIRNLQRDLIGFKHLPAKNSKGRSNADGIYGNDTNEALKRGKSPIFKKMIAYKNGQTLTDLLNQSLAAYDIGRFDAANTGIDTIDNYLNQNPVKVPAKLQRPVQKENKENTMKKINEIAMGYDMMEFEAEERARDAQSEQGADALSILQGLIDGGKITADELEQAAAMLRKGEEEAERKLPGNQGFSKKEQDAMSDEEYDAYFRMNETSHGSFTVDQKVTYSGKPATIKVVDGPGKGKDNRVIITQDGEDKSVKASEITTSSTAEEKTDAAKNESKVQTPEQENTLYESRFNNRNNQLFDKLINKWTK